MVIAEFYESVGDNLIEGTRGFKGRRLSYNFFGCIGYKGIARMEIRFYLLSREALDYLSTMFSEKIENLGLHKTISQQVYPSSQNINYDLSLIIRHVKPKSERLITFFNELDSDLHLVIGV